jgi:hypothetical protein
MLTITCSPDCRRANRIFVARCVRLLCDHLGIDRPPPATAHRDANRVGMAIADHIGPEAGHQCFDEIIGYMVLNRESRSVIDVYDRLVLVHKIEAELLRVGRDCFGFWPLDHHNYCISTVPSNPVHLWKYDGFKISGWQKYMCNCPDTLLRRLQGLPAGSTDTVVSNSISDLLIQAT